ncbi:FAD:protein FMN transferase [Jiella pacifica]|uniref:FAD:protein FMN transferase n=1 Tax=Jiella pacifica TaxID=2696469 RepID=A0A6N9TFM8_9HYPH|nr:FAD:protein FMN transferase [Jiella pacifica]NDW07668.1 FAD:protein FMN transferase [Jiella pacifica]
MDAFLSSQISRRRLLFIGAAFAGSAVASSWPASALAATTFRRWTGQALGAHATIQLAGAPQPLADEAFAAVTAEIGRLEAIFSLYRSDSELSRLNRQGRIAAPSPELLAVLTLAASVHRQTGGLFDPTVQPLFATYAEHFAQTDARSRELPPQILDAALAKVGFEAVRFDTSAVAYGRPEMAMTLNGIAQGFITDRVAALLKARGFDNLLLDVGEIVALGGGRDGRGWRIGLKRAPDQDTVSDRLTLTDRAVATSMLRGTTFDAAGRMGHIIHPRQGLVTPTFPRVSVVDVNAARADALSTAAALMTSDEIARLRARGTDIRV